MAAESEYYWKKSWLPGNRPQTPVPIRGWSMIFISFGETNLANLSGLAPFDPNGIIPSLETWQEIAAEVAKFYSQVTNAEIDAYNLETLREQQKVQQGHRAPSTNHKRRHAKSGYVYLLRADNGLYKIGKTTCLDRRITELSIKLPYELELIHAVESDNIDVLEQLLHEQFADKRVRGEWFALSARDVEFICSL